MEPTASGPPLAPLRIRRRERAAIEIARCFSSVFNPFVTALALFVVIAHATTTTAASFWALLALATAFTSLAPIAYVYWLYATGRISDLDMSIRAERERVLFVFVLFYALGTLATWLAHSPPLMVASLAGYTVAALLVAIITRGWKISMHALGVTAPLVVLVYLYGAQPLPFFILIPLVDWSRVKLRKHTPLQVVAGTALGACSVLVFFRLFRLI